jgi:tRNA threonylcarbamoyl adenosine modification protein (Sua5/YciO/YrdC/YwlC family)
VSALSVSEAIDRIVAGGLVGFPTETSWGLAADARSEGAMNSLRSFKGRDADKPVSVLLADPSDLDDVGAEVGSAARRLVEAFWPGPLTLVVKGAARFARGIASPDGTIGFRCSPHAVARELALSARARGVGPLTATSLNASGEPDCTCRAEALRVGRSVVSLVDGDDAGGAPASTVVDATGAMPRILREGAIPRAELARILSGELAA